MTDYPTHLAVEEYRALRATIRERGSVRVLVTAITFLTWAVLLAGVFSVLVVPVAALIPLAALWAGFEVALAIHIGVERIGRYLEVRYEAASALPLAPAWEGVIGELSVPSGGVHPLFNPVFLAAILVNMTFAAAMAAGVDADHLPLAELAIVGALHAVAVGRVVAAGRFAAGQRQRDRAAFVRVLTPQNRSEQSN